MQRWRLRLLASLVVMAFIGSAPGSAATFDRGGGTAPLPPDVGACEDGVEGGELAVPARRALAFATATATLTRTPQRGTSPTNPTTRMQGETGQGEAEPAR